MRNAVPYSWIEQAEARQVLASAAMLQRISKPSWAEAAQQVIGLLQWLPRSGSQRNESAEHLFRPQ